jgi:hypothetical protein
MSAVHRFGAGPLEAQCAVLLSRGRSVLASAAPGSAQARLLQGAGFRPLASQWHCVRDLRTDPRPGDRKSRLALSRSLAAWRANGLTFELTTVHAFGSARLEEEFYYPILVRELYSRGRAPHGAQNLDRFRRLARPHTVLALVRSGSTVCGAGLLHAVDLSQLDLMVAGTGWPDMSHSLCGQVYCLREGLADCRRAFVHMLALGAARGGWSALSYGADTAWVHRGYVPVILEKLRWTDAILATTAGTQPHFHRGPGTNDDTNETGDTGATGDTDEIAATVGTRAVGGSAATGSGSYPGSGSGTGTGTGSGSGFGSGTGSGGTDDTGLTLVVEAGAARFERHAMDDAQHRSLTSRLARIDRRSTEPALRAV